MSKILYADYNATSPLSGGATSNILKSFEIWGNPSSSHRQGQRAQAFLEQSRTTVAKTLGVESSEVVFTSGGSEANSLALMGSFFFHKEFRLLISAVEHPSVRDTSRFLETLGVKVKTVPVNNSGMLDLEEFDKSLHEFKPNLVSIMSANNETGVVFPIPTVASHMAGSGALLHTDAVQALGKLPEEIWKPAHLISVSAHKIQGPKGAGALIVRKGLKLNPVLFGGSQEMRRRGGTQNMLGISGFAGACSELEPHKWRALGLLRDRFEDNLLTTLPDLSIQGKDCPRIPNTSNLRFPGIRSEILLTALDLDGVCVSAGSACSSGSVSPSHVLVAMGLRPEEAHECLRLSFGPETTEEDLDTIAGFLINHVNRIQKRRT